MKLATLPNGQRDGRLVVVSKDLTRAADASAIVPSLQAALDNWEEVAARLAKLSDDLNRGNISGEAFREQDVLSPLPRAYAWIDSSGYVNHVELVRKARGAEMPPSFWTDPLIYQGGSDTFLPPHAPIPAASEDYGIDLEAEIVAVIGDLPMNATPDQAEKAIRCFMLVNDVTFRNLVPGEMTKGFGFFHSKPSSAFSPVAITPDELGDAWTNGKINLPLLVTLNGRPFGCANAGVDMTFDFPTIIANMTRTRALSAGTIIGAGTVSNRDADGGPGKPIGEGGVGYSCIAEIRVVETLLHGKAKTEFLRFGDRVQIEMRDTGGRTIFGSIDQVVEAAG